MPESELPWLVAGLPVYYHRSNGDRGLQGAENRTLEPVTSIRLKIEESWYASMDCKVQKSGPWVCFYGGHSTGCKLGNHPKNIEPCAHRATTPPGHEIEHHAPFDRVLFPIRSPSPSPGFRDMLSFGTGPSRGCTALSKHQDPV